MNYLYEHQAYCGYRCRHCDTHTISADDLLPYYERVKIEDAAAITDTWCEILESGHEMLTLYLYKRDSRHIKSAIEQLFEGLEIAEPDDFREICCCKVKTFMYAQRLLTILEDILTEVLYENHCYA